MFAALLLILLVWALKFALYMYTGRLSNEAWLGMELSHNLGGPLSCPSLQPSLLTALVTAFATTVHYYRYYCTDWSRKLPSGVTNHLWSKSGIG